jgi:hypothetical protein
MSHSQWHRFYTSNVAASPGLLFSLLSDMPHYDRWLPPSGQFARTTDVEPYPVQLGSRYHEAGQTSRARTGGGPSPASSGQVRSTFTTRSGSASCGPPSTFTFTTRSSRNRRAPS